MVPQTMIKILIAALAAATPPAKFDVTEWRVTSARNAWLECVVRDAAYIRSSVGDPVTPSASIAMAETQCWVMRYAVHDALPDLVRANLIAQGIHNPQRDVVDTVVDSAMKIAEADVHRQAIAYQQ